MKIIYNNWFPFKGFVAINLFGVIFARPEEKPLNRITLNHEMIHTAQMKEMWYIGFYIWYFVEWAYQAAVRLFNPKMRAYRFITMEQEAYDNEWDMIYLKRRLPFAWKKHIGKWE